MKKFLKYGIAALTCIMVLACQKNVPAGGGSEAASLIFRLTLPSVSLDTKAHQVYDGLSDKKVVDDPFAPDISGWTDYEKLIDARVIYRLTMFLVDRVDGVLVGYRDFYYSGITEDVTSDSPDICDEKSEFGRNGLKDDGTEAIVTFDYDHPLHSLSDGSLEKLDRGEYRMIVVANWSPVTITSTAADGKSYTRTYSGLKDRNGNYFGKYVESVLAQYKDQTVAKPLSFSRNTGSDKSDYTDYHNMMDFALYSCDKHFLCALNPQPLVLVQDFELQPGMNKITGQLKRTWARLRIAVENLSDMELTVHDLKFGENTTRNESFLFFAPGNEETSLTDPDVNKTDAEKTTKYGSPAISDSDGIETDHPDTYNAWVAFHSDSKIGALGNADNSNRRVLFDGYILDCNGKGNPFTYDLNLEYEGQTILRLQRAKNGDGTWAVNKSDPYSIEDGGLYVLQNQTSNKRVLKAGAGQIETEVLKNDGSGNFVDDDYSFEMDEIFRLVSVKDGEGNIMTETIVNQNGDRPGEEQAYPIFTVLTYNSRYGIGAPQNNGYATNLALVDKDDATPFVIRNDGWRDAPNDDPDKYKDMRYLFFYSTIEDSLNKRCFINVNGNSNHQDQVNGWTEPDGGSTFYLHKVVEVKEGASYDGTVTLSTVDPESAVVSPVKAIYRNDFINILITVSYNKDSGEIDFKVKDWDNGGGDIEFN